jgi:hypothetical protein
MSNDKDFRNVLTSASVGVMFVILFVASYKYVSRSESKEAERGAVEEKREEKPRVEDIGDYLCGYQSYDEIVKTFKGWEAKAKDIVEVGTYGSDARAGKHYYIKISNEFRPSSEKVLITACIHGNEPWSTSTVVSCAGKIISLYGRDEGITKLIDERTIYIIPVVSPDSYPTSRSAHGVDPNRNFPTLKEPDRESVPPIKNLRDFFNEIKPDGVLSGHTYGRIFLIPWGDSTKDNPNLSDYERVASEMCDLSGYRYQRACQMYNRPIYGTEIDWYHRNGAFAMVMEFGSHQRKPTEKETKEELDRTFYSIVHFIKESPKVEIKKSSCLLRGIES